MTRLLALLLILGLTSPALAQDSTVKYWVFLKDKVDTAAKTESASRVEISQRAQVRRARRAGTITGSPDQPVSGAYVDALTALGASPIVLSRWLNAVSVELTNPQAEAVRRLPFVSGIRPVGVLRAPNSVESATPTFEPVPVPGAPASRLDYGGSFGQLDLVNAIPGLEAGLSGAGVMLGIIDTGTGTITHPALMPIVNSGRLVGQRDFTGFDDDNQRHGLSVLSIAAGFAQGNLIGPAYGAEIILARTEYAPTETNQEEDNLVAALEWMESEGVDVVNVSLGYFTFDSGQRSYVYDDMDGDTAVTTRAADIAAALGVTVVTSAGNEGTNPFHYIGSPADGDSVITVGAVDPNRVVPGFSSYGPTADGRVKPNVAAMGVGVRYANGSSYSSLRVGTSWASPMVAAVATQMLETNPNLGPMDILRILEETTFEKRSPGYVPDTRRGHGVIDAEAAIAAAAIWVGTTETVERPFHLSAQAYPNPSRGVATLRVDVRSSGPVEVEIYDILGRRVATTRYSPLQAGQHLLPLSLPAGASGWYGYRVTVGAATTFGSLSVIR